MEDSLQETENQYSDNMMTDEISQDNAKHSQTQVTSNTNVPKSTQLASNPETTKPGPSNSSIPKLPKTICASSKTNTSMTIQLPPGPSTSKVVSKGNSSNKADAQKATNSQLRKKKNTDGDEQRQEAYLIMKELYGNKVERDECHIFGELVAGKLRKLKTDYARDAVQHVISNILWEASLGKYDYPQHSYSHSRPQTSCSAFHSSVETPMQSPSFHSNDSDITLIQHQSYFEMASPANTTEGLQNDNNPQSDLISQALLNLN